MALNWIGRTFLQTLIFSMGCVLTYTLIKAFWENLPSASTFKINLACFGIATLLLLRVLAQMLFTRVKDFFAFLDTLEHELTHALVATLFLQPPKSLKATQTQGGEVVLNRSNFLIALAPYSLPLWSLLFWGISLVAPSTSASPWIFGTWFFATNFMIRQFMEIRTYQTDLKEIGFLPSLVFAILCQSFFFASLLSYSVTQSWSWFYQLPQELLHTLSLVGHLFITKFTTYL